MRKFLLLAAVAVLVSSCTTAPPVSNAPAAPKQSVLLGERVVSFKADHDAIAVGNYAGAFKSLFFKVEKNDIELFNLVVVYGNGEKQKLETRLIFNQGARSRMINLNPGKRIIKTIQFAYKTVGTWQDGRARVAVYGVK
jgi:hypothetical protein